MEIALFPERLFTWTAISRERARWLNLLCSGVLVIVITTLALDRVEGVPHFCLFQKVLGIPCPGCGILHSLNAGFHGDVRGTWTANPAGLLLAVGLLFQVFSSALVLAGIASQRRVEWLQGWVVKSFISAAMAVWIYRVSITIF
jgi:hypothetical protein